MQDSDLGRRPRDLNMGMGYRAHASAKSGISGGFDLGQGIMHKCATIRRLSQCDDLATIPLSPRKLQTFLVHISRRHRKREVRNSQNDGPDRISKTSLETSKNGEAPRSYLTATFFLDIGVTCSPVSIVKSAELTWPSVAPLRCNSRPRNAAARCSGLPKWRRKPGPR
jgi:hypothetical protein